MVNKSLFRVISWKQIVFMSQLVKIRTAKFEPVKIHNLIVCFNYFFFSNELTTVTVYSVENCLSPCIIQISLPTCSVIAGLVNDYLFAMSTTGAAERGREVVKCWQTLVIGCYANTWHTLEQMANLLSKARSPIWRKHWRTLSCYNEIITAVSFLINYIRAASAQCWWWLDSVEELLVLLRPRSFITLNFTLTWYFVSSTRRNQNARTAHGAFLHTQNNDKMRCGVIRLAVKHWSIVLPLPRLRESVRCWRVGASLAESTANV